ELASQEIADLEKQKKELEQSASTPMTSSDSTETLTTDSSINPNIAILEIRSAAGGDEAGLFAGDLCRMYVRLSESKKWSVEELDRSEGNLGQIKEVVLKIKGPGAYYDLKNKSGFH